VRLEHRAELVERLRAVANVRVGDDHLLARREVLRGAEDVDLAARRAVARPRLHVPADPAEHAAVPREGVLGRVVEDDHVAFGDAEVGEIGGEFTQIGDALGIDHHDVGAAAIHQVSGSHVGVRDSEMGAGKAKS
jgi:hypothetical protein